MDSQCLPKVFNHWASPNDMFLLLSCSARRLRPILFVCGSLRPFGVAELLSVLILLTTQQIADLATSKDFADNFGFFSLMMD